MENFVSADCVNYLSKHQAGPIFISKVLPSFLPIDMTRPRSMLREIKVNQGFAVVGLCVPENFNDNNFRVVSGKVLMESHKSPSYQPQKSMDMLVQFMRQNLGISKFDTFQRPSLRAHICHHANPTYSEKENFHRL